MKRDLQGRVKLICDKEILSRGQEIYKDEIVWVIVTVRVTVRVTECG